MEAGYTEIIDKYLNGELSKGELEDFNKKLESDEQLRRELKLEEDLNKIILEIDVNEFRKKLSSVRREMLSRNKVSKPVRHIKRYLLAASIIIIAGLSSYFFLIRNQSVSNEQLFAQYYNKYPSDIAERSDDFAMDDPFLLGLTEYEKGNFKQAAEFLKISIKNDSIGSSAYLYLGISYLENDSLNKAIENFKITINNNDNLFVGQAKWYLALTYIKSGDKKYKPQIIRLLNEIIAEKGDRAIEAKELLKKVQKATNFSR